MQVMDSSGNIGEDREIYVPVEVQFSEGVTIMAYAEHQ
jgi:hypothetical protein